MKFPRFVLLTTVLLAIAALPQDQPDDSSSNSEEGFGRVHIDISCSARVAGDFDRALALLHNFWYGRALQRFEEVSRKDPGCAMAYWGAAMTYNHPFWDPPSQTDETAAGTMVQKGLSAPESSARQKLYLAAVTALYKNAGTGAKSIRDQNYRDAMARAYAQFRDDETALFYGLSILGAIPEGSKGVEQQEHAARLFEEVYARHPDHPGVLHYLIHAYNDPVQEELHGSRSPALAPDLVSAERQQLLEWTRRPKTAQALALRARIVLLSAEGRSNTEVARQVRVTLATVGWRRVVRFPECAPARVRLGRRGCRDGVHRATLRGAEARSAFASLVTTAPSTPQSSVLLSLIAARRHLTHERAL